ncbi:hypothetical protein SAMN05444360_12325 [Chryseobacterium carnipullorum]|nr:hypothetical protein SAMN05444360_12325 [Chryseobacterium carnipullorum]
MVYVTGILVFIDLIKAFYHIGIIISGRKVSIAIIESIFSTLDITSHLIFGSFILCITDILVTIAFVIADINAVVSRYISPLIHKNNIIILVMVNVTQFTKNRVL